MTEQATPTGAPGHRPDDAEPPEEARAETGVPALDRVLRELDGLDDLPLEEHLATFERAHASLRSALDARPDGTA